MPELSKGARAAAGGELPRVPPGRWRCFLCDGPDARWRPSIAPSQEAMHHRYRHHLQPAPAPTVTIKGAQAEVGRQ